METTPSGRQGGAFEGDNLIGLDVFSADGQRIGRVAGYVDAVQEDRAEMERGIIDAVPDPGKPLPGRRLQIDGHGTVVQAQIAVPEEEVAVDLRGRRVTLRLTLAQIEQMPHGDPQR